MEADSFGWHSSPSALNDDRERDVELTLAGYRVLRFTYEHVTERPRYVVNAIRAAQVAFRSRIAQSRRNSAAPARAPQRVPRSPMPDDVTITPYRDGPLLVRGPFRLLDQQGREIDAGRETVALCRCGKSRLRPFCDGTHKLVRFKAPSAAEVGREI